MAYDQFILETITTPAGVLTVKLNVDELLNLTSADLPSTSFVDIGEFIERIENKTGWIEIPYVQAELVENYSVFTMGFWFKVFNDSISNGYRLPQFEFFLDEGSGDTFLFFGVIEPKATRFNEHYFNGTSVIRTVSVKLLSLISVLKELDFDIYLDDVISNYAVSANDFDQVNSASVSYGVNNTTNGNTVKYRIAVVSDIAEYDWGAEITANDAPTNMGGDYDPVTNPDANNVQLSWTSVGGGISYAIYRTYNQLSPNEIGFLGYTSALSFMDNYAGVPQQSDYAYDDNNNPNQIFNSAPKFVKVIDFFRRALVNAFFSDYQEGLVTVESQDVKPAHIVGEVLYPIGFSDTYIQVWHNTGTVISPTMERVPYFNKTHSIHSDDYYIGDRFNVYELIGYIARLFALYPRFYFDLADNYRKIKLYARGQLGSPITMPTQIVDSYTMSDSALIPRMIMAYRELDDTHRIQSGEFTKDADLDLSILWHTEILEIEAIDRYETLYVNYSGNVFSPMQYAGYYNYDTEAWVNMTSIYNFQAAWVNYYYYLTHRKRQVYHRTYYSLKCPTSHTAIFPTARAEINDLRATKTYYANEVRKDILKNILTVEWVEQ